MNTTPSAQSPEYYRIFVGGLSYEVDNHRLKETFVLFGDLKKALVIRDQSSGQSRGYGFVTFSSKEAFIRAMANPLFILGRKADCHQVLTKGALKEQEQRDLSNKIFVGGISQNTQNSDIRKYFSKFGPIKESRILYDGKSGKSRGFAFVLYQKPESVDQVFSGIEHKLKSKVIEIKRFSNEKMKEMEELETLILTSSTIPEDLSLSTPTDPSPPLKKKSKRRKHQKESKVRVDSFSTSNDWAKEEGSLSKLIAPECPSQSPQLKFNICRLISLSYERKWELEERCQNLFVSSLTETKRSTPPLLSKEGASWSPSKWHPTAVRSLRLQSSIPA